MQSRVKQSFILLGWLSGALSMIAPAARGDMLVMGLSSGGGSYVRMNNTGTLNGWGIGQVVQASAYDSTGTLFISNGPSIRAYNGVTGAFIRTVYTDPGRGLAGLQFAPNGDLYVSARGNSGDPLYAQSVVYRMNPITGTVISSVSTPALNRPSKIVPSLDGNLLVTDIGAGAPVYKLDLIAGTLAPFASDPLLSSVAGLDYGPDGNLYAINSGGDHNIYKLNPTTGSMIGLFSTTGMSSATDLLFLDGNLLWASSMDNPSMALFNATTGAFVSSQNYAQGITELEEFVPEPASLVVVMPALLMLRQRRHAVHGRISL